MSGGLDGHASARPLDPDIPHRDGLRWRILPYPPEPLVYPIESLLHLLEALLNLLRAPPQLLWPLAQADRSFLPHEERGQVPVRDLQHVGHGAAWAAHGVVEGPQHEGQGERAVDDALLPVQVDEVRVVGQRRELEQLHHGLGLISTPEDMHAGKRLSAGPDIRDVPLRLVAPDLLGPVIGEGQRAAHPQPRRPRLGQVKPARHMLALGAVRGQL
ncbi:unnamed protein product [Clonostachys byssicola]|uniref:Uncharacterized protein n=1 Tax=Clonostachys byssicola TaxID=160290 RepID=A0A9N9U1Y0_9HYPO|nr:unnamed protein product [Clonostachys byssicola]